MEISALFDLTGKTAVVTGGSSGLGRDMALALARAGANLVVPDVNGALAEQSAAQIRAVGREALALQSDIADPDAVERCFMTTHTYPSSIYPWLLAAKSNTEIRQVAARDNRVNTEDVARVVDDRTLAISVSHVSPKSGFRHDLAALSEVAHAHNAVLIVDAAQSAGALDLDVRRLGVDFLSTCAMKWLLGAPGVGFLFVAREHVERLEPPHVGYAGVIRPPAAAVTDPLTFRAGARRHEQGMPSRAGVAASRAGLDLLLEVGMATVERHVLELSGLRIDGLRSRGLRVVTQPEPRLRAGVVALPVNAGEPIVAFLRERAVDVWTDPSATLLRIDPHVFNDSSDIERLFDALDEFRQTHDTASLQGP